MISIAWNYVPYSKQPKVLQLTNRGNDRNEPNRNENHMNSFHRNDYYYFYNKIPLRKAHFHTLWLLPWPDHIRIHFEARYVSKNFAHRECAKEFLYINKNIEESRKFSKTATKTNQNHFMVHTIVCDSVHRWRFFIFFFIYFISKSYKKIKQKNLNLNE